MRSTRPNPSIEPKVRMSALGQKQTFAVQNVMSALPPKADIDCHPTTSELIPFSKMRLGRRCRASFSRFFEIIADAVQAEGSFFVNYEATGQSSIVMEPTYTPRLNR